MKKTIFLIILVFCSFTYGAASPKPTVGASNNTWGTELNTYLDASKRFYSALEYGADPTGAVDSLSAIQDAIDAAETAGGGVVFLQEGTYKITATIDLKINVNLVGEGFSSILSYTGAGVAVRLTVPTTANWFVRIEDLKITTSTGTHGLQILGVHFVDIKGVQVTGFSTAGIHLSGLGDDDNAVDITIDDCLINANADGILADNNRANSIRISGTNFSSNTGYGINANSAVTNAIHSGWTIDGGCTFGNNTTAAIMFDTVSGVSITGNYFEGHEPTIIFGTSGAGNSEGIVISGNFINGTNIGIQLAEVTDIEISGNAVSGFTTGAQQAFVYIPNISTVTHYTIENNGPVASFTNHVVVGSVGTKFGVDLNRYEDGVDLRTLTSGDATPSVIGGGVWRTAGTTTITNFADGTTGEIIIILAETSITITDGTSILLNGSVNFDMTADDTVTLIRKSDAKWYELSRGDNGA